MNIIYIILILAVLYFLAVFIFTVITKLRPAPTLPIPANIPASCTLVNVTEIEPPHDHRFTATELREQYMEAEAEMTAAHDAAMAPRIRRQMAECLIQGWPLDVAVCQSAYSFLSGTCRCHTCRSLIESQS